MVDTRSKVSKQGKKGKHGAAEVHPQGHSGSPAQNSKENSVDRHFA